MLGAGIKGEEVKKATGTQKSAGNRSTISDEFDSRVTGPEPLSPNS